MTLTQIDFCDLVSPFPQATSFSIWICALRVDFIPEIQINVYHIENIDKSGGSTIPTNVLPHTKSVNDYDCKRTPIHTHTIHEQ